MSEHPSAPLHTWLIEPMEPAVAQAINRLRHAPDVQQIAVMPDVHLATEVCVGTVFGTSRLLYPQAVGGDIGCGMLAIAFEASTKCLDDPRIAGQVLSGLGRSIPALRRHRRETLPQPQSLREAILSHPSLESIRRDEGALQFGTLGGGNHFIELQADQNDQLWLMIHSGSRAMGQAIRANHLASAQRVGGGFFALDAETEGGQAYLHDLQWARQYAAGNRMAMAEQVVSVLESICAVKPILETLIKIDHNHVAQEIHDGRPLWIHRKGAMPASAGRIGLLPGSMGTASFHVEGRGNPNALCSSAHGAGRAMSREKARKTISQRQTHQQMQGIWYDYRKARTLIEEAPSAYKDIRAVLRAQKDLVRVRSALRPLLNFKA